MISANVLALAEMNAAKKIDPYNDPYAPTRTFELLSDELEVIHKYNNGFTWVLTEDKEDFIGSIRRGVEKEYFNLAKRNLESIYCLLDKKSKGIQRFISFIIVKSGKIMCLYIPNNLVNDKYFLVRKCVLDFLNKKYIKYTSIQMPDNLLIPQGWINIKNKLYDVFNLPNDLTINGNLDLSYLSGIEKLPSNLTVKGHLNLTGQWRLDKLPKGLKIDGNLNLTDTYITKIPDDLQVKNIIINDKKQLKYVPEHLENKIRLIKK